jgi:transposase
MIGWITVPDPISSGEAELARQLKESQEQLRQANVRIALLEAKIDLLLRKLFGAKSEKLDPEQLMFLMQGLDEPGKAPEPVAAEAPRRSTAPSPPRERGPRLPEHLPVIEEVIEPEVVKVAPQEWRRIGEEVSERLDYEPAKFLRRRTVRPKYVHRGEVDTVPIVAPLPPSILERSIVSAGLLAQIIVSKYCDHLPLYRQESIYWTRHGVWLPRQTMAEWVGLAADWLRPIYDEIRAEVFARGYVQIDETPIRYLAPGHGKTKQGYFWTSSDPSGDVLFQWQTSRAAACLENVVPAYFTGIIQADGYEAYKRFARERGGRIQLASCMAHVRRKFYEAQEHSPKVIGWLLRQIAHLYGIEQQLRQTRAGPRRRQAARASASRPILARLHRALVRLKTKRRFLPRSSIGRAIDYALSQWPGLLLLLEDGRLEIDNNRVENAIRPTAVGKKNWLFIGEAAAGDRSAIIYTVIESCRRRGIDPFTYLREVFTRLPSMTNWQIKNITPAAWAKSHQADLRSAA